jgi:hypothetical protein
VVKRDATPTVVSVREDAFRAWLSKENPEHAIGCSGHIWYCPLSCWLSAVHREIFPDVSVYVASDSFTVGTTVYTLPLWAQDFVRKIDQECESTPATPITAGRALAILDHSTSEG